MTNPQWLEWAQRIQAISQNGLAYSANPFDRERYASLSQLAAEIISSQTHAGSEEIMQLFNSQSGYATPKVDVRGVVFKNERILLVREKMDGGKWTLPGGWADVNETPAQAVEREMREEAGVIVKAKKLLAVYDRNLHGHPPALFHAYKLFFLCEMIAEATPDPLETAEPTYFKENPLPELSIERTTEDELKRMFELHRNPVLPTDFD